MKTLVLNSDYQALAVCSAQRGFSLVYAEKADLVEDYSGQFFRTVRDKYAVPSVIRLRSYVKKPHRKVPLTRNNLYLRDGSACVYCNSRSNLTIDHVKPKCDGGSDDWSNLVTACRSCNKRKGGRTPEAAGMKFVHGKGPFKPSFLYFLMCRGEGSPAEWDKYISY